MQAKRFVGIFERFERFVVEAIIVRSCGIMLINKGTAYESSFLNTPTRYESVGCDDENFSSPKEYEFNSSNTNATNMHALCLCWPPGCRQPLVVR